MPQIDPTIRQHPARMLILSALAKGCHYRDFAQHPIRMLTMPARQHFGGRSTSTKRQPPKPNPHNLNHLEIDSFASPLFPGDYALPGEGASPISIPFSFNCLRKSYLRIPSIFNRLSKFKGEGVPTAKQFLPAGNVAGHFPAAHCQSTMALHKSDIARYRAKENCNGYR